MNMTKTLFLFLALTGAAAYAGDCPIHFSGDDQFGETLAAIQAQKDCHNAAEIARNCAWGSGADVAFAGAAQEICEKAMGKFSKFEKSVYDGLMSLCGRKYEKMDGTMFRSMAAHCALSQAENFKDLKKVETPKGWDFGPN